MVAQLKNLNDTVIYMQIAINIFVNVCVVVASILVMRRIAQTSATSSGAASAASKKLQRRLTMFGMIQTLLICVVIALLIQQIMFGYLQMANRTLMSANLYIQDGGDVG